MNLYEHRLLALHAAERRRERRALDRLLQDIEAGKPVASPHDNHQETPPCPPKTPQDQRQEEETQGTRTSTPPPLPPNYAAWLERVMTQRSTCLDALSTIVSDTNQRTEERVRAATMFLQNTADVAAMDKQRQR